MIPRFRALGGFISIIFSFAASRLASAFQIFVSERVKIEGERRQASVDHS